MKLIHVIKSLVIPSLFLVSLAMAVPLVTRDLVGIDADVDADIDI